MDLFFFVALQLLAYYLTAYIITLGFAVMLGGTRWLRNVTGFFLTRPIASGARLIKAILRRVLALATIVIDYFAARVLRYLIDPLARRAQWLLARVLFPRRR
jgi:hypothetical protein